MLTSRLAARLCSRGGAVRKKFVLQMLLATLSFAVIGILLALSVGAPDCSSYCLPKQPSGTTTPQSGSAQQTSPSAASPQASPPEDAEKLRGETLTAKAIQPRLADP